MKFPPVLIILTSMLSAGDFTAAELRCEYHAAPLAISTTTPRFSWKLKPAQPDARDLHQTANEIQVSDDSATFEKNLRWSSGKVQSTASDQIVYQGSALSSRDRASWRVRVWGSGGEASPWSEGASFGVGLLKQEDWSAL